MTAANARPQPEGAPLDPRDHPGVIAFPPLLAGGVLLAGLLLHWLLPWRLPLLGVVRVAAAVVLLPGSAAFARWGERVMQSAGTNVHPGRPSTAIVTGGPFRYSRNPLYVSLIGLYLGVTLAVATAWPLVLLVPMLLVLDYGIIRREERYLEAKFGEPYRAYKARVRRWL